MSKAIHFEKSMLELEEIVKQLEHGDLSLEQSLKYYEKGVLLTKKCQEALLYAEQKIETLRTNNSVSENTSDETL